jgi:hypothetical protein
MLSSVMRAGDGNRSRCGMHGMGGRDDDCYRTTSARARLANYIRKHGPVKTVRVSSAQAKGSAKKYAYYGAARYLIDLNRQGEPTHICLSRARSDRRSFRLAEQDALAIAAEEGRLVVDYRTGKLNEQQCAMILEQIMDHPSTGEETGK